MKIFLPFFPILLLGFSCNDHCDDKTCRNDMPHAYFKFNIIDAETGEDLIFGTHPINHPDSIEILHLAVRYVEADNIQKTLGFFAINDTIYIKPDRRNFDDFADNYDILYFQFESLGMGKCCEEFEIVKAYYNDSVYQVEPGKVVQLKKN